MNRRYLVAVLVAVLAAGRALAECAPVGDAVPGRLLVKFRPGVRLMLEGLGHRARVFASGAELWQLEDADETAPRRYAEILRLAPEVLYAEPDYIYRANAVPSDTYWNNLCGMRTIGAPAAWDIGTGSTSVVVAVSDTGIDFTHPDLEANVWTNSAEASGLTGVDDDGNGYVDDVHGWDGYDADGDPRDQHYHGTHVAGTVGALGNNGLGVVGVNWHVGLMSIRGLSCCGSGATSQLIAGIEYATAMKLRGVPIVAINASWGGSSFSQALLDAINAAGAAGILFVTSAGNSGVNIDVTPQYPAAYDSPYIISVGATKCDDTDGGMNWGPTRVDLSAPGVSIYSTFLREGCSISSNAGYTYLTGTSMATPHVAGAVALYASLNPAASATEIKERILATAAPIASQAGRTLTGARLDLAALLAAPPAPLCRRQRGVRPARFDGSALEALCER